MRTCSEGALWDEWESRTCESNYDSISKTAAKCCSDGRSSCAASQLCADPAAFDPSAQMEQRCIQVGLTQAECPSSCVSHESYYEEGYTCTCLDVPDSESCAKLLPGVFGGMRA